MEELLDALHRPPMKTSVDLASWIDRYRARPTRSPVEDAAFGGKEAKTVGLAFLAGYQAALRRLVPSLPWTKLAALAATEAGGAHPKAIETRVEGGRIFGQKRFITLGAEAEVLLVVARRSAPGPEGRPKLEVASIDAHAPGVRLEPLPAMPFVPDVPHATLTLDASLEPHQLLDGDGYLEYLKPFRTLEDLHVLIAILACAAERARATGGPRPLRERLSALFASLVGLATLPPLSPALHVALGGALSMSVELLEQLTVHSRTAAPDEAESWSRDLALLGIANSARERRLARAWEVFG